ncbi:UNG glycosylase, partial [Corythaeola cristata]|nr:UNG glycosylase [Corythaeola cristata]
MIGQKTLHCFFSAAPAKKRGRSPEPGGDAEVASGGVRAPAAREGGEGAGGRGGLAAVEGASRGAGDCWGVGRPRGRCQKPRAPRTPDWSANPLRRCPMGAEGRRCVTVARQSGSPPAVKVVILGQDPYHGPNQAHGLCFSVQKPVPPPPSLENIYKELSTDIEDFTHPGHGDLTGWAKQGVLLLNAVLTVRAHQATSHKERGWEQFTDVVVSWLNKNLHGVVFMLWGAYAQKKGSSIDRKRHHVLQTVHPSPFSVNRGFFGCRHFSKTNELLKKSGKKPIDWRAL